jgi:transcriptional regulator with GAF, ATPase, and Fis domain
MEKPIAKERVAETAVVRQDPVSKGLGAGKGEQAQSEVKKAWEQAEAARAEVEVLRKAMVALAQNGRMDEILDTLLRCVQEVVPYTSASVLFEEEGRYLFVARASPRAMEDRPVIMFELQNYAFLQRVVLGKKSVHVSATAREEEWQELKFLGRMESCIAVPLLVAEMLQGLLLIGSVSAGALTKEHFRLAKLLAIPFAVAVHRARLYEWAQIYAHERKELIRKADASREH